MACRVIVTMSYILVSLSVIIMVTKGVFATRGCPDGMVAFADSCYLGLDGSMKGDWSTAIMQCDRNNASIMVPSSDGENEFIINSFQHHGYLLGVWINCNDTEVEGEWNCSEGGKYPTDYRKWEPDQPDDEKLAGDQDYGFMITRDYKDNPDILGYWGDVQKETQMFIVCKRPRQISRCQSAMNVHCLTENESGHFVSRFLDGHTLDRYPTDTVAACGRRCTERQDCHSFNIKRSSSGSKARVCELNNATRYQVLQEYFRESTDCYYFDLW